ncbi:MAG: DUF1559 domain-containing protein [Planctomycetes bacterium]|nr:DUF1559 domain-containing protein [Planctomycetota bacterium]
MTFLLLLGNPYLLAADRAPGAAARAKQVASFLDEHTFAVVRVDFARMQVKPLVDKVARLIPIAKLAETPEEVQRDLQRTREAFLRTGARTLYFVYTLADVARGAPLFIVPLAEGAKADQLHAIFEKEAPLCERRGDVLVAGNRWANQWLRELEPTPRPELVEAFKAAGDAAIQVLLLPPPYSRRVIEELMPTLPAPLGGRPSTILTEGVLWGALSVDGPPRMSVRLVIQSRDAQAATALRTMWLDFLRRLSVQEKARGMVRDFDTAFRLLTPQVEGSRVVLTLSEEDGSLNALLEMIGPPLEAARARTHRTQSMSNLKRLALAMHFYHDRHKTFPPVGSTGPDGKPLLSWRVHLLPHLDQRELYEQFHLDEPWDSPHNRELIDKMPAVFRCPASKFSAKQGLSTYRVVSGKGTVFPPDQAVRLRDIADGTSNTIMIVEVDDDRAVIWTKPEGLPYDPDNPGRGLGGQFHGGFNAAFCDGSVRFLPQTIKPAILRLLLIRNDRTPVPPPSEW